MVTTLYLRGTTAAWPKPNVRQSTVPLSKWVVSTLGGGQDSAATIYPLDMLTTPGSDGNQSVRGISAELGAPYYGWYKAWISAPLAEQTISGTLTVTLDWDEGSSSHNTFPRIKVYVWKGDNSGVRGVLYAETDSTVEADVTDGSLQTFFGGEVLSSVDIQAGDRILIEVMGHDNNDKTLEYLHAINFDGAIGSGRDSVIQFSQNLLWHSTSTIQKNLAYRVLSSTTIQKTLAYTVPFTSTIQKNLQYTVPSNTAIQTDLEYAVSTTATTQEDLAYSVLGPNVIQKNLSYAIQTGNTIQRDLAHSVATTAVIQRGLIYSILYSTTIQRDLQYTVPSNIVIQRDIEYVAGIATTLQKGLQYTVASSPRTNVYTEDFNDGTLTGWVITNTEYLGYWGSTVNYQGRMRCRVSACQSTKAVKTIGFFPMGSRLRFDYHSYANTRPEIPYGIARVNGVAYDFDIPTGYRVSIDGTLEFVFPESGILELEFGVAPSAQCGSPGHYDTMLFIDNITIDAPYPVSGIQKNLSYAIPTSTTIQRDLAHSVATASSIQKELAYSVSPSITIQKGMQYTVASSPRTNVYTEDFNDGTLTGWIITNTEYLGYWGSTVNDNGRMKCRVYACQSTKAVKTIGFFPTGSRLRFDYHSYANTRPEIPYGIARVNGVAYDFDIPTGYRVSIDGTLEFVFPESGILELEFGVAPSAQCSSPGHYDTMLFIDNITIDAPYPAFGIQKNLLYSVLAAPTIQKGLAYSVLLSIIQKGMQYTVPSNTVVQKGLEYAAGSTITIEKDISYSVISQKEVQKTLAYTVPSASIIQKDLEYTVLSSTAIQHALEYTVSITATIQKNLSYSVTHPSVVPEDVTYAIQTSTTIQRDLAYSVATASKIQKYLAYSVLQSIVARGYLQYAVPSETSIQRDLVYAVPLNTVILTDLEYRVSITATTQEDMAYSVLSPSVNQKNLSYAIQTNTKIQRELAYSAAITAVTQKGLIYSIPSSTTIKRDLQYTVPSNIVLQRYLEYAAGITTTIQKNPSYFVLSQITIQKSPAYTVASNSIIQKDLTHRVATVQTISNDLAYVPGKAPTIQKNLVYEVRLYTEKVHLMSTINRHIELISLIEVNYEE